MGYHSKSMRRRPVSALELVGYRRRADELLTPEQQDAVIDLVAYEPTCGDVIPGTGGLRKVRIGRSGSGKRGGARVIYYYHHVDVPIFLLALYAKNEKADLTAAEKKEFAALVKELVVQWRRK
jgi:RelE toxin of RelE / RelB toxin-antitoxin system